MYSGTFEFETPQQLFDLLEQAVNGAFTEGYEQMFADFMRLAPKDTGRLRFEIEQSFIEQNEQLLGSIGMMYGWNLDILEHTVVSPPPESEPYAEKHIRETYVQTFYRHPTTPGTGPIPAYLWTKRLVEYMYKALVKILRGRGLEIVE